MRLLWLSNVPWAPSGYGEQTNLFTLRLRALGHDIALVSNWGLMGAMQELDGMTVYPGDGSWGNSVIGDYAEAHNADLTIALCDAFVLHPNMWPDDLRMAVWAPLDHYPIPPRVLAVLQHPAVTPIAMSRFGEEWMQRFSLDPLYVPHGIDTKMFYPRPEIRDAVRDELEIPRDAFLVGMVAANKASSLLPRKGFPQALDAFAQFAEKHEDAYLYVHSSPGAPPNNGLELDTLALGVGCPEGRVRFPPEKAWRLGMSRQLIANLYPAFDVLLNPSMGEGFGVPIVEAQACGCPVIASDHSAMTELTQAGWLVTGDRWWDGLQNSFLICPSIGSIWDALEAAYDSRGDQRLRDAAAEFARQYDADRVTVDYWIPALEQLAKPREIAPLNGKTRKRTRKKQAAERRKALA